MRFVNEVRHVQLGDSADGGIEGVVRVRGFEAGAGARKISYQRHDPESVVIRRQDEVRRLTLSSEANNVPAIALPVAMYVAARVLLRKRRGR